MKKYAAPATASTATAPIATKTMGDNPEPDSDPSYMMAYVEKCPVVNVTLPFSYWQSIFSATFPSEM